MTRRFFGLQGALLGGLLLGSCKQDSITTVGIGTPAGVSVELKTRTIAVADSVRTFALVRDQVGNPLAITVTLTTGCTAGIVSVGPASDAPLVRTAFVVRAVGYGGTGCVIATASGFIDTMKVTTVPASLVVTGVTGTISPPVLNKPDTANSGAVVTYSYQYKDAAGNVMTGLPASATPSFSSPDTTIANPAASGPSVAGRAPGVVTITLTGTAGLSTIKTLTIIPLSPFSGTTAAPAEPGQILKIVRDPAGPVFDANTAVSIGSAIGTVGPDTLSVRVSDVASSGTKTFSITGVGPNDLAYSGGTYTVNTPPAFTGTVTPSPLYPSAKVWIHRDLVNDPVFDVKMKAFLGTSASSLSALTVDTSTVRPDSFKVGTLSDLAAAGTYVFQFTRVGTNLQTRRGTYVLPVGTWGGTVTPNSAAPMGKIVLHKGAGDPQFTATSRVYLGGVRSIIESFSTDTAVVIAPWIGSTSAADMRISRMAGTLAVDGSKVFTSTSTAVLDSYGYGDETPDKAVPITANGNYYRMVSGSCGPGGPLGVGVASTGGDDCDDYFRITNSTAVDATVTVNTSWFIATDIDVYICDGTALSNPVPNNVPKCGSWTSHGYDDVVSFDGAAGGSGTSESTTFTLPAGATYVIWANTFDAHGVPATVYRIQVIGLP